MESYASSKQFIEEREMKTNDAKTQFFIFKSRYKKYTDTETITLGDVTLVPVTEVLLLGCTLDQHFTLGENIKSVSRKGNCLLFMMKKSAKMLPDRMLRDMYTSTMRSRLENCSPVFHSAAVIHTKKLEVIQKKAARIIMRKTKKLPLGSSTSSAPTLVFTIFRKHEKGTHHQSC